MADADFTQPEAERIHENAVWQINPNIDDSTASDDLELMLAQVRDTLFLFGLSESDLIPHQIATVCYGLALQIEKIELLWVHIYSQVKTTNGVNHG